VGLPNGLFPSGFQLHQLNISFQDEFPKHPVYYTIMPYLRPPHFHNCNTVGTANHTYHCNVTVKSVWQIINKYSCSINSIKTYKLILQIPKHTIPLVMDFRICILYILMKLMLIDM
jgi:hypothetical protein